MQLDAEMQTTNPSVLFAYSMDVDFNLKIKFHSGWQAENIKEQKLNHHT